MKAITRELEALAVTLTALRRCTDRDLRAMIAHCQQRTDEALESGYVGAGALFAG